MIVMAQTKRRRRTKHKGNAAGSVEVRGRTGRPLKEGEKGKPAAKGGRPNRYDTPPTWRGAINRSLLIILPFALVIALVTKQPKSLAYLLPFMLVVYVPLGYYTDLWMYNRRRRQKAEGKVK
jgi:hypothetical protein